MQAERTSAAIVGGDSEHGGGARHVTTLFVMASFLGSFLLFLIQPMAARLLLPVVGGSSALWTTALVFFQTVLLAGYLFAHRSTTALGARRHPVVQLLVVMTPLLVLPVSLPAGWIAPSDGSPAVWVLLVLAVMVGLPFFALSTSSPTLQRWLAWTDHPDAADPYFLYSAGNIGSVAALVGYPLLFEPRLSLAAQGEAWAGLYVLFVVSVATCAWIGRRHGSGGVPASGTPVTGDDPLPAWSRQGRWLVLSAVPTALLLSVTRFVTSDIAPFPLLWVLPLLLYLVTFIIVFGRRGPVGMVWARRVAVWLAPVVAVSSVVSTWGAVPLWLIILVALTWFFAAALTLHARLAEDRPAPAHLTRYFAALSLGGALGGTAVSLVAPLLFDANLEFPIAIGLTLLLLAGDDRPIIGVLPRSVAVGVTVACFVLPFLVADPEVAIPLVLVPPLVGLALVGRSTAWAMLAAALLLLPVFTSGEEILVRDRSFFGTYVVAQTDDTRSIVSGTTVHGAQDITRPDEPLGYYSRFGPIGEVFSLRSGDRSFGVVGLGAGALAAYGGSSDEMTFYEIDPLVVELAGDPALFTYLADTAATIEVQTGDGRALLERDERRHDILVIDAFSSDAIPVHLLTSEAFGLYRERLSPDGLLAVHISNRHLDLASVVATSADAVGMDSWLQEYEPTPTERAEGAIASWWVIVADSDQGVGAALSDRWSPIAPEGPSWTDDFSNIVSVIDW